MNADDVIRAAKYLPKDKAHEALRAFVREFIGKDVPGSLIANRTRHKLRQKATRL